MRRVSSTVTVTSCIPRRCSGMSPSRALLPVLLAVAGAITAAPADAVTVARGPGLQAFDSRQGAVAYVSLRGSALTLRVRSAAGRTRVVARSRADDASAFEDFADLRAGSDTRGATVFVFSRGRGTRQALWAVDATAGRARRLRGTDRGGRPESQPSLYAGRLGYFAGDRLVERPFAGGSERRVPRARGEGAIIDAAIGPGLFLVEVEGFAANGGPSGVGVLRDGRYDELRNTPNGEETSSSVDYLNVLDGQLHVVVTSDTDAGGVFRAPLTRSRARRERAAFSGEEGASPFSGDTYVVPRRAGGRTDLATRRLRFSR